MSGRDDHGVSATVRESALASLLEEPSQPVVRHLVRGRSSRALCGDTTGIHTDCQYATTCETCRERHKLADTRRVLRKVGAAIRRGA